MTCVPGIVLCTSIGTCAPFSAISGALMTMPSLCAGLTIPASLIARSTLVASKAAFAHSPASPRNGASSPAASAVPTALPIRTARSRRRRRRFMQGSLVGSVTVDVLDDEVDFPLGQHAVLSERRHHGLRVARRRVPDLPTQLGAIRETFSH